jgi:hypothetical protein
VSFEIEAPALLRKIRKKSFDALKISNIFTEKMFSKISPNCDFLK